MFLFTGDYNMWKYLTGTLQVEGTGHQTTYLSLDMPALAFTWDYFFFLLTREVY